MRINDRSLTGTGTAETGKAVEAQRPDEARGGKAAASSGGGGDRVELSGTLGRLSQTLAKFGSAREARVQQLAAQYQSGNYHPDSAATGRAMVSEALSAGGK
jgi:anti-sigma28 factor (negative regulator of flagellin synthesis)